jgi:ATPase subunit of ABC transporter with duplicated ATPase domains
MLQARGIARHHGGQVVLDDVSVQLDGRDRVGVVGRNGVGKSTLLRILGGLESPDQGRVERRPATLTVGYLPQEPDPAPGETLRAYLARRTGVAEAGAELDRLTERLATDADAVEAYSDALDRFVALGGGDFEARAAEVTAEVGLLGPERPAGGAGMSGKARPERPAGGAGMSGGVGSERPAGGAGMSGKARPERPAGGGGVSGGAGSSGSHDATRLDQELATLSGGEAARALLAAILLSRHDVLLLDEPTNNLDFAGLDQLEAFAAGFAGALLVVSHDRAFLDRAVTRIVEIDEHSHRLTEYAGGWTGYLDARALARAQQYEAHDRYVNERDRLRSRLRTQHDWSAKGARKAKASGETDKFIRHHNVATSEKLAGKRKITERQITRLDVVDKPWEGWRLQLSLQPAARSGDVVARLDGAVIERSGETGAAPFRLGPVDLEIAWQERVGILGRNGSGKTTLLGGLLGRYPLVAGRRHLGPGVVVGELDQSRGRYSGAGESVLATFQSATGLGLSESRSLLAKFGIGADHVGRAGAHLSPGERSRALLAEVSALGVNCLILDEPTNHLDLEAIEQLEGALASFDGTLVVVSHDRRFLEAVELSRTIELD